MSVGFSVERGTCCIDHVSSKQQVGEGVGDVMKR